jgi:hypothetical protein
MCDVIIERVCWDHRIVERVKQAPLLTVIYTISQRQF